MKLDIIILVPSKDGQEQPSLNEVEVLDTCCNKGGSTQ